ncbi:MAG: PKD domain-containing protein [Gammaproteobacteria bacterium]|nr:PKD domain-containing protein [Gammaproteobacteria bacterium]
MRRLLKQQLGLVLALFTLVSTSVFGANVGYYEMCNGEGRPWAITPITAAGHTPVYLADLSSADLNGLDVLFVTNCNNFGYDSEYLSRLPEIDQAVQNGLVLMIHDRKVDGASAILPGGANIKTVRGAGRDVNVVDNTTALTNGPGGVIDDTILDHARNTEHGYIQAASLPAGYRTILSRPNPSQSVVTVYDHGLGNVIYSSVPLDYYAGIMPICMRFVDPQYSSCQIIVNVYAPNVVALAAEVASSKPIAKAGVDQAIDEGTTVQLDGSGSNGRGSLSYQWKQLSPASPVVSINATSAKPTFTAPMVDANLTFTFQLLVTDQKGHVSDPDTVDITVKDVNTPPVADAGDDFTIKAGALASLDGSQSYDADGDPIQSYNWVQIGGPAVSLQNPDLAKTNFEVPNQVGQQLVFELMVNDGKAMSQPSRVTVTIVDNAAPIANAGVDQTRDEGNTVLLNALGSYDPDKDGMLFDWRQISGPSVTLDNPGSPTPYFTAPKVEAGGMSLVFEVTVMDMDPINAKASMNQVVINVRNINDAPACELARPSVASLWPPNHKMRPVEIEGVSDTDSIYKNVAIIINSVTMDEPVVGRGSGHSSPDAVIQDIEPRDNVLLRAERQRRSDGRVYQVNFTASDGFESCTGSVQVTVPTSRKHRDCHRHDRGKHKGHYKHDHDKHKGHGRHHKHRKMCEATQPIDNGQLYDATELHTRPHHHKGEYKDKMKKKLKALKEKREEHKKKHKKHNKKKKHDKDDD